MNQKEKNPKMNPGAGLGLRRELLEPLLKSHPRSLSFLEVAPENWIPVGGKLRLLFDSLLEIYPLYCHGLSLNIGGKAPLDKKFILQVKNFLKETKAVCYSEHLSFCADNGHLYDLFPIPFTEEAVKYVSKRIKKVQDILERPLIIENASYYFTAPISEMSEIDFINAVLKEADCELLLDVNNVYVNSVNHAYNPVDFIKKIPSERIRYFHIAGHDQRAKDLIIDTHGDGVIDPVWDLLSKTYSLVGLRPTLLERDFNIPPLKTLLSEIKTILSLQNKVK